MQAEHKENDIVTVPPGEAIGPGPRKTAKRERTTIEFPYNDLDNAVATAKAVERAGGTACALDQLAAALGVTISGPFRVRVSNARTFGLTENASGQVRLSELGRAVVDPAQEAWARAEAFLRVPLFSAIYERYKGYKLPVASGLETEINALGVSSKQSDKARQALMRSARQAGFFAHGEDRLVRPSFPSGAPSTRPIEPPIDSEKWKVKNGGGGGNGGDDIDPIIRGLLARLPKSGDVWPETERKLWLQLLEGSFKLIYNDSPKEDRDQC